MRPWLGRHCICQLGNDRKKLKIEGEIKSLERGSCSTRVAFGSPGQMVHSAEAGEPLNFPTAHTEQATDSTPVAALVRYFPAAQLEQVAKPVPLY